MRGRRALQRAGGRPWLAGRRGRGRSPVLAQAEQGSGVRGCGHAAARPCPQHAQSKAGPVASSVPHGALAGQPSRPRLPGTDGRATAWPEARGLPGRGRAAEVLCLVGRARPAPWWWAGRGPARRPSSHVGTWWSMLSLFRTQPQQAGEGEGPRLQTTEARSVTDAQQPHTPWRTSQRTA